MSNPLSNLDGLLPNNPPERLIDRFSYTGDIHPYTVCSKQYGTFEHYGFAKALPIQAWFGDAVHMTIEMLYNQYSGALAGSDGDVRPGVLPSEEDVEFHTMTSISILKSRGVNARESAWGVVIDLMSRFNQVEGSGFYERIEKTEVRLETVVEPDGEDIPPYIMNGVIDVLVSSDEEELEIWDYKAMRKPEEGDEKLEVLKNQMFNYYEIVKSLYPERQITTAVLYFVNELREDGSGDPIYSIDLTDRAIGKQIQQARRFANQVVEKIRDGKNKGKFPIPLKGSVDSQTCGACFLRWSCPSTDKEYTLQAP
tara:strand:- start:2254 stop:3186 length:933 start_codon:yes stop_codon:yes gene_type:complete